MLRRMTQDKTDKKGAKLSPDKIAEMIRLRAYEVYRKRGSKPGDHMSDWLVAEKQVRTELGSGR